VNELIKKDVVKEDLKEE